MLHKIVDAEARSDFTVHIRWDDGTTSVADFREIVGKGVAAKMADPRHFVAHMQVGGGGDWLSWPDDVEFSADSLWYKAHPDDLKRDYGDVHAAE